MCGLVAVIQERSTKEGEDLFKDLLYADVVRGVHSTGIISVQRTGTEVYKKAIPAWDFLELPRTKTVIFDADSALVGHNRHATVGAKTSVNAHPFTHGNIHLVHNGTLRNKHKLHEGSKFQTDSEAVAYNLSIRDPIEVLEELEGAYAFIWNNEASNTINVARNEERALHCFLVRETPKGKDTIVLCSERDMGAWLIGRSKFDIISECPVPEGVVHTIDLDNMEVTRQDFTPKKSPPVQSSYYSDQYPVRRGTTYPKDKWVTFELLYSDSDGTGYGETIDGGSDVIVNLDEQTQLDTTKGWNLDAQYTGRVLKYMPVTVRGETTYDAVIAKGTVRMLVQEEAYTGVCGICNQDFTSAERADSVEYFSGGWVHSECIQFFMETGEA